jgi:hypothetical protein
LDSRLRGKDGLQLTGNKKGADESAPFFVMRDV